MHQTTRGVTRCRKVCGPDCRSTGSTGSTGSQVNLREAFEKAGFGWATSHTLRKTMAAIVDANELTAREIADQLGIPARTWPKIAT
jgi:integrase